MSNSLHLPSPSRLLAAVCSLVWIIPVILSAQAPTSPGGGSFSTAQLENPLGNITLIDFFLKIIDIIIVFAIPIIVFFIILAGFRYVTARGNTENIKSATSALTWAVIGGVVILGARIILVVIQETVKSLRVN